MINIIDDGTWCKRCKMFHPTCMWHDKYGKEESREGVIDKINKVAEKRPGLFGLSDNTSVIERAEILGETIRMNLENRKIDDAEAGECVICGYPTSFVSKKTGRHVCSDECLYKENGWRETATGETLYFE